MLSYTTAVRWSIVRCTFVVYIYLNIFLLLCGQQLHSVHLKVSNILLDRKPNVCRMTATMTAYCVLWARHEK
jgi:hypothetical protein